MKSPYNYDYTTFRNNAIYSLKVMIGGLAGILVFNYFNTDQESLSIFVNNSIIAGRNFSYFLTIGGGAVVTLSAIGMKFARSNKRKTLENLR